MGQLLFVDLNHQLPNQHMSVPCYAESSSPQRGSPPPAPNATGGGINPTLQNGQESSFPSPGAAACCCGFLQAVGRGECPGDEKRFAGQGVLSAEFAHWGVESSGFTRLRRGSLGG